MSFFVFLHFSWNCANRSYTLTWKTLEIIKTEAQENMTHARIPLLNNKFTFTSGGLPWTVNLSEESHRLMDTNHLLFHCHGSRMLLLLPQVKGEVWSFLPPPPHSLLPCPIPYPFVLSLTSWVHNLQSCKEQWTFFYHESFRKYSMYSQSIWDDKSCMHNIKQLAESL